MLWQQKLVLKIIKKIRKKSIFKAAEIIPERVVCQIFRSQYIFNSCV